MNLGALEFWDGERTVESACYGLFVVPLFDHKLYVRVFFCDGLEVVEKECAGVG